MSNDLNSVTLVGRLTRDSELKYTNTGTPICKFSIASSSYAGQGKDNYTSYFDITLWGKQGEAIQQYLEKGKQVAISGELKQDRWEQEGQKRSKVYIVARNVQLLSSNQGQQSSNNAPQGQHDSSQSNFQEDKQQDFIDDTIF